MSAPGPAQPETKRPLPEGIVCTLLLLALLLATRLTGWDLPLPKAAGILQLPASVCAREAAQ